MMCNKSYIQLILLPVFLILSAQVLGQSFSKVPALLEPSGTQYFQNQYLANPAMAGIDTGLHINASYRNQWNGINGAPVTKFLSADGNVGNRVGAGLRVFNDAAGLLNRTRVALTYAYHLPLSDRGHQLSLGLSLALNMQRLNTKELNGDPNDPSIGAFNRRDDYFEGEFGMAYTNGHLNLQAAVPNIRALVTGDHNEVDGGNTFYSAASYRFTPESVVSSVEPKVCFRGIRGYDNIVDIGVNVGLLHDVANVMAMYHTSKSITTGIGVDVMKTLAIRVLYGVQTGGISTYVNNTYEIGATIHLFR